MEIIFQWTNSLPALCKVSYKKKIAVMIDILGLPKYISSQTCLVAPK